MKQSPSQSQVSASASEKVVGLLRLMRPANIVTAVADILAGIGISGFFLVDQADMSPVLWLVLANAGLYGGGVVMNDFFDANLDSLERPERPIPSGLIKRGEALTLGLCLLAGGVIFSFLASTTSGAIALAIAIAAVVYDKWAKHHHFMGPLLMGICRGLSLLLGISIIPAQMVDLSFLGIIPIIYIAAITMVSRGEVHGGSKRVLAAAMVFYVLSMAGILLFSFLRDSAGYALLFIALWAVMVFLPLGKALSKPVGPLIGKAVKAGVLALILMDAAWAAAFGNLILALVIALLLPFSLVLARLFAVT
jgi:4-hydroxybenzoate polyprenyltransferase